MANVCNLNAIINCPHSGIVTLTGKGTPTIKAAGQNVITYLSIVGAPVAGCTWFVPCTVVASATPSLKVTADGNGVVLDSSTIVITNPSLGPQPGTIGTAGQNKLTATS